MVDVLTKNQRSFCMSRIRSKNTHPELIVRSAVWSLGFRYRLHGKKLPGRPDIVLGKYGKVIFVHGCFWHKHSCSKGRVRPKTNKKFWDSKLSSNVVRDRMHIRALIRDGWKVLVVWECEISDKKKLLRALTGFLGKHETVSCRRSLVK
jgi:DNA mismatch endonuclease (patch repair protein)